MLRVVAERRTHEYRFTQKTPYRSGVVSDIHHDLIETLSHYGIEYRKPEGAEYFKWLSQKRVRNPLEKVTQTTLGVLDADVAPAKSWARWYGVEYVGCAGFG